MWPSIHDPNPRDYEVCDIQQLVQLDSRRLSKHGLVEE